VACQLSREGAEAVYIWGRRKAPLEALAARITHCVPMSVDVGDEGAVRDAVESIVSRHGRLDLLANMAAISGPCVPAENYPMADFEKVYRTNVFGTFLTMKYCLPHMQRNGFGAIVNACSCSGLRGYPNEIGYGSSKFAVLGLTQNAASENGRNGVRVNCVSPGWVDTDMMDEVLRSYDAVKGMPQCRAELTHGSMDRPATPEEVGEAVCFLLSDAARYINGTNLICDGGKTLH
jgi:NAD(P)-dependent dehydrogenase (short-subunit alcohol dehydrogenase family)